MDLFKWSTTAASNDSAVPDGAPEGWTGANVNNWGRETMARLRLHASDASYIDETYQLAAVGTKTLVRNSTTQFTIQSCNATAHFTTDRRIKIVGATTDYGFVTSSSFSTDTTVNVTMDSGDVPTTPTQALVHTDTKIRGAAYKKTGSGNGLDADKVDGYEAATLLAGLQTLGSIQAQILYESASQVRVKRGHGGATRIAFYDNTTHVVRVHNADIVIDLSSGTDREDVSEAPSTWYYLYLCWNGSTVRGKISTTAPSTSGDSGYFGYHPTNTPATADVWRCIGAVFNNSLSNIQPFDYNPRNGLWAFRQIVSAFTKTLGTGSQTTYTSVSLSGNVPATARTVRLSSMVDQENVDFYYGHESLNGLTVSSNPTANGNFVDLEGGASSNAIRSGLIQFEIAIDSSPTFVWGNVWTANATSPSHEVNVVGWYDDFGFAQ